MTLAFSHVGYVGSAYALMFLAIAGYAAWLVHNGRRFAKRVPHGRRRWM